MVQTSELKPTSERLLLLKVIICVNEQTREELGAQETVVQKIKKRRLQWFGHVKRMEGERLPNAALHGHVEGKRSRGRQRNPWIDNVREDLKEKNIDLTRIGKATRNREVWRSLVRASSSARWWKREKKNRATKLLRFRTVSKCMLN